MSFLEQNFNKAKLSFLIENVNAFYENRGHMHLFLEERYAKDYWLVYWLSGAKWFAELKANYNDLLEGPYALFHIAQFMSYFSRFVHNPEFEELLTDQWTRTPDEKSPSVAALQAFESAKLVYEEFQEVIAPQRLF